MRNSLLLACKAVAALLVTFTAREALAGCDTSCLEVTSQGFTITPALDCIKEVSVEDSVCVCSTTITLQNACGVDVRVTELGCDADTTDCTPKDVVSSEEFTVSVLVPTQGKKEMGTERNTQAYRLEIAEGANAGSYELKVETQAMIDPDAGGCSVSRVGGQGNAAVCAMGLGLAVATVLRRRRR